MYTRVLHWDNGECKATKSKPMSDLPGLGQVVSRAAEAYQHPSDTYFNYEMQIH